MGLVTHRISTPTELVLPLIRTHTIVEYKLAALRKAFCVYTLFVARILTPRSRITGCGLL